MIIIMIMTVIRIILDVDPQRHLFAIANCGPPNEQDNSVWYESVPLVK
jgi:hypothetical protein